MNMQQPGQKVRANTPPAAPSQTDSSEGRAYDHVQINNQMSFLQSANRWDRTRGTLFCFKSSPVDQVEKPPSTEGIQIYTQVCTIYCPASTMQHVHSHMTDCVMSRKANEPQCLIDRIWYNFIFHSGPTALSTHHNAVCWLSRLRQQSCDCASCTHTSTFSVETWQHLRDATKTVTQQQDSRNSVDEKVHKNMTWQHFCCYWGRKRNISWTFQKRGSRVPAVAGKNPILVLVTEVWF